LVNADEQPGIFLVKTIVSNDRLKEAETVIKQAIRASHENITLEEFDEAKRAIINNMVNYFAANSSIAQTFLFLERFKLPARYFDDRAKQLQAISLEDMKKSLDQFMTTDNLLTVRVGRVPEAQSNNT
jgi:zinc protease